MAGENLHLSMLLTAQAEQARRELAATATAARDLGKTGPEVTTSWSGVKPALETTGTAAHSLQAAVAGLNRETRAQSAELVATARETAEYRSELEALRAQFNPVFAASKAYEQELREIAEAEQLGAISAAEAASARERATAGIAPMTAGLTGLGRVTSVNVMHSANLAAQFNDIGVMAMAMQNPLQLALQQGTQINQVFGQMGGHRAAIRQIGPALLSIVNPASLATIAVIALGTMGVQWLLSMREAAISVEDALKDLETGINDLRDAMHLSSPSGLDDVEARYGRITTAVERLIGARQRLALIETQSQLDTLNQSFAARAGSRWYDIGISDEASGVLSLRRNLDLGRRDAEILRGEIVRLGTLHEPAELADRYAHLAEMVQAVITELGATDERRQFLADLLEGEDRARQIAAILENHGQTQTRRADEMLAGLQSELAIREAINTYGEESTRVTELRIEAERRSFEESLRTLDVSEEKKQALRDAWDAANGLASVNMAAGIAAARDRAREMADEIARAVEGVQSLAQQGAGALEEARIRATFTDPVEQARRLAEARMLRVQAPLRNGAEGLDLAALDAQVRSAGNEAAEVARLNAERERLNRNRRDGTRASAQERKAVADLIDNLQTEVDLLREADPVQQEMIRQRGVLASATAEERAQVEELIRARERENDAIARMDQVRETGRDVLRGIVDDLRQGASAGDLLDHALSRVLDRIVEIGEQRALDWLFGAQGSSSGGILGGLISAIFGISKHAKGDVIGEPTLFAYGDKPGQLGVMGEAGPEAIMPLTHPTGQGVGAIAGGIETTLPLARLASGKLGVMVPSAPKPFAAGGTFGFVPDPPSRAFADAAAVAEAAAASGAAGSPTVINHWNVTTPDAKSFESRATVARGARRLVGMSARYS